MKKVKSRAALVAMLVLTILALLGVFVFRFVTRGGEWASFVSNPDAYAGGALRAGTVTDRDGEVLYAAAGGAASYAADELTRRATLHVVGDRSYKIGAGVIYRHADLILGWDPLNGLWDPAGEGGTLALSIDAGLQRTALEALGDRSGAVAVIDYTTGEILCAVSAPTFDPDAPPEDVESLPGVYLNRALSTALTPGSTFKLVTLTAAIECLPNLYERDFACTGKLDVGGGRITCPRAHGKMKIEDALASSCNCVFASLALELGPETMARYAEKLGLTARHDIDGLKTAAGRYDAAGEGSLDLAWSGAGQYHDLACPVAMARLCAAIANNGAAPALTMLLGKTGDLEELMSPDTAVKLDKAMDYCVRRTYGAANFPGLALRAKSGTAETGAQDPTAWFVGYLADPDHPYAFAVVLENAGSGASQAAPVANAVLQAAVGNKE